MRVHFIAIGGSAMHNLALALNEKGETVTGSDDAIFDPSKTRLEKAGLLPEELGWFPEKIQPDLDAVILGMHAKKDNPELLRAQKLNLPIFSYPEFLYQQGEDKIRVVIGGSHGKTTITSMILHVLHQLKKEVDFMVGAQLDGFDNMVHLTKENKYMVLEGDEYLSSPIDRRPKFHLYKPQIALLSGIAWDHINVFPTFENYVKQFELFIETLPEDGVLVFNQEDQVLYDLVKKSNYPDRLIPYKIPSHRIENGKTFVKSEGKEVELKIFGQHNLSNMAGALAICRQMGIGEKEFYRAIQSFTGASKRLEKVAEKGSTLIYKDFAHSPSKVTATTQAVKDQYPDKKLLACFELHTYSSLNADFLKEYEGALDAADEALVFYSPDAVKIKGLENIDPTQIEEAFNREGLIVYTEPEDFQHFLKEKDLSDTVLLLMSSGNYGGLNFDDLIHWI